MVKPPITSVLALGLLLCASTVSFASAKEERVGPTYEISEPDMEEAIRARLNRMEKSGELAKKIEEAKKRSIHSAQYPKVVQGIGRAMKNRTYYFNPAVRVNEDVKDASGRIVAKAGTMVSPLDYVSMDRWLLFFDGSDPKQVTFAKSVAEKYDWAVKPILVAGGPLDLQRVWKRRVYFDQGGFLVRKLGIQNVPALVTQEGKELRIDEFRY
jgi:conjugal transfer pilus assembly protein TraW